MLRCMTTKLDLADAVRRQSNDTPDQEDRSSDRKNRLVNNGLSQPRRQFRDLLPIDSAEAICPNQSVIAEQVVACHDHTHNETPHPDALPCERRWTGVPLRRQCRQARENERKKIQHGWCWKGI